MTKDWTFDQPLDEKTATSSTEERAKIAALFNKNTTKTEELDYVAAFEMEQQKAKEQTILPVEEQDKLPHHKGKSSTITTDYKQYLADRVVQNKEDIAQSQKKIEELHQLIDEKNKQNKKLQAISVAIDDL